MSQIFVDPATGRRYEVAPDGTTRWIDLTAPPSPTGLPHNETRHFQEAGATKPKTVSGIVGLIVAVLALTLSWVPIVNNIAPVFALIGGILGVIGLVANRPQGKRSARWTAVSAVGVSVLSIAIVLATQAFYVKSIDQAAKDIDKVIASVAPSTGVKVPSGAAPDQPDVAKFGALVTFEDTSSLTCTQPVTFKRAQYSAGGEQSKIFLKAKCTFTNRSGETFQTALTSSSMSAGGEEGDPVFQEGLDSPSNPVLSGRSVTWWVGFGVNSTKDVQLSVRLGFLDFSQVTFT